MKRIALPAAVAALTLVSLPVHAAGKAGLWQTTTTMTMDMPGQDMHMPAQHHSGTFCMTPQQVASNAPPQQANGDCHMTNMHHAGNTTTADMVCKGRMNGTGHFSITYDSATHYRASFSMATNGMSMNSAVEGTWLKTDCAGAAH